MSKVRSHEIEQKERLEMISDFYQIVSRLKNKKEVAGFFIGLLTASEALMFARRIQIAQMLLEGRTILETRVKLKVGVDTIMNVSRWLYNDDNKVFRQQISLQLKQKQRDEKSNKKVGKYPYNTSELDKYPEWRILRKLLGLI